MKRFDTPWFDVAEFFLRDHFRGGERSPMGLGLFRVKERGSSTLGFSLMVVGLSLYLSACATLPRNIDDACVLLDEKSGWYGSLKAVEKKWGVPIHVQLAIIHQESKFKHNAKPPRKRLFWFIPGPRASSAFGYAQVLDGTWDWYKQQTGNTSADRDNFDDAVHFIGWYVSISQKKLGISKWDAKSQYLAYHEGHGGYKRKTYRNKPWLVKVAEKVERNSALYRQQLARCHKDLKSGFDFWSF